MLKAYVASTNRTKVEAVKIVLNDYEVESIKTESGVSNQPFSDEETLQGAYNRAKSLPKDGLRIGLEGGVMILNNTMFLINYGVMIDQDENVYQAGGARIPLPDFVKERLMDRSIELSQVMEEYTQVNDIRSKNGAIGIFTNNQVERVDLFVHIMKLLYGQYQFRKGMK